MADRIVILESGKRGLAESGKAAVSYVDGCPSCCPGPCECVLPCNIADSFLLSGGDNIPLNDVVGACVDTLVSDGPYPISGDYLECSSVLWVHWFSTSGLFGRAIREIGSDGNETGPVVVYGGFDGTAPGAGTGGCPEFQGFVQIGDLVYCHTGATGSPPVEVVRQLSWKDCCRPDGFGGFIPPECCTFDDVVAHFDALYGEGP